MNFALLGDDPHVVPFLSALGESLKWSAQAPETRGILGTASQVRNVASWADLIQQPGLDAVIIAGFDPDVLEGARQLAASGKTLLIWPAARQSSAFIYQLTLIYADREVLLFPLLALRGVKIIRELSARLAQQEIGPIQHLRLERTVVPSVGKMTWEQVEQRLLADIDLMRALAGEYDQVTASRSGEPPGGISFVSVTLSGEARPQALCSIVPGTSETWMLTVTGETGTFKLSFPGDPLLTEGHLERTLVAGAVTPTVTSTSHGAEAGGWPSWLLARFTEAAAGKSVRPNWTDLSYDFELLETIDRSLKRRRTIDVHFETPSERSAFKSQMTAAGCSLLMLTLLAVVVYLGLAQAFPLPQFVKHILRVMIFAPLGIFLALQLLIFATRPARGNRHDAP